MRWLYVFVSFNWLCDNNNIEDIKSFVDTLEYKAGTTYKIVKYNYPLFVLGYTDLRGQFFPVAFMYTSHEKVEDFSHFINSFKTLCQQFKFDFSPKFLVTDAYACKASATALANLLPETTHLMWYFHVKASHILYNGVMSDITSLHECMSERQYDALLKATLAKWKANPALSEPVEDASSDEPAEWWASFVEYFRQQWVSSKFHHFFY